MKYYYDFKNEEIEKEIIEVNVTFDDKNQICNVIKTNKNLLFFHDMSKDNIMHTAQMATLPGEFNLILSIPLDKLEIKKENDNTIIFFENKTIVIYNYLLSL